MLILSAAWFMVIVSAAFPPAMLITIPIAVMVTRRFWRTVRAARAEYFAIEDAKARRAYMRALSEEANKWG